MALCRPGKSLEHIYSHMLGLIGQKLQELGVVTSLRANSITKVHVPLTSLVLGTWSALALVSVSAWDMREENETAPLELRVLSSQTCGLEGMIVRVDSGT